MPYVSEKFDRTASYFGSLKKLAGLFWGLRKLLDMSNPVLKVKE